MFQLSLLEVHPNKKPSYPSRGGEVSTPANIDKELTLKHLRKVYRDLHHIEDDEWVADSREKILSVGTHLTVMDRISEKQLYMVNCITKRLYQMRESVALVG